jgi:lipopolysaccharide export system protein LptA
VNQNVQDWGDLSIGQVHVQQGRIDRLSCPQQLLGSGDAQGRAKNFSFRFGQELTDLLGNQHVILNDKDPTGCQHV